MKRFFAFQLALLLLIPLAACGGGNDKPANAPASGNVAVQSETEPQTTERTDGLPDTNMDGFSLNLMHDDGTSVNWIIGTLDAEEQTGEFVNDAIYDRNLYIEERFNCKLNITSVPNVDKLVEGIVTGGDASYDVIMQTGSNTLRRINLIQNFRSIPHISWDEVWWNPGASNAFSIGETQIAACGNFSLSYLCGATGVTFNKVLWDDLQIKDDPYQLVRDGKWTVDKFFELCRLGVADLNGDGVMKVEDDRYGVASTTRAFMNNLTVGAGYPVVAKDKDNMPYLNLNNNELMVNYMIKLLNVTISDPYLLGNSYTTSVHTGGSSDFNTGHALFAFASMKSIEGKREMEDDFGVLPMPKENEQQENYITNSSAGEVSTLPRSANPERFEYVGMLLEAMAFRSQTVLTDAFKEVCLQSRYARDQETAEMLDIIFSTVTFDQGYVFFTNQFYNKLVENTFWTKNVAVASTIASMRESIEKTIADTVEAVSQMP